MCCFCQSVVIDHPVVSDSYNTDTGMCDGSDNTDSYNTDTGMCDASDNKDKLGWSCAKLSSAFS